MLLYTCDGLQESDLGPGGDCFDGSVSSRVTACTTQSVLLAGWSVGGSVSCLNYFMKINHVYDRILYILKAFHFQLVVRVIHSLWSLRYITTILM